MDYCFIFIFILIQAWLTVGAVVIHQKDLLQQMLWRVGDDASYCPLNYRKSLV